MINCIGGSDVGDNVMLATIFVMLVFFQCVKSVTNVLNLSPTHFVSDIRHQHVTTVHVSMAQNYSKEPLFDAKSHYMVLKIVQNSTILLFVELILELIKRPNWMRII